MMVDANAYLGESLYRNSLSAEELEKKMDQHCLDAAVVRPFKPCDYNYDKANKALAETVKQHPRLIGFARVNPLERDAPEQVCRAIREYGLKGVHLHPWEDNFAINSPVIYDTVKMAEELNVPLYVSTGYPNVSEVFQLLELLKRFPRVTAVATHAAQLDMSGGSFDDVLIAAKECENMMFDFSGCYRRDFMEELVDVAGETRAVFGSNTPYMSMAMEIDRIQFTQLSDRQKELIFGKNILCLLGLC